MNCSLPGSFIHGIFQARVLEWVAIAFSRRLPTGPILLPQHLLAISLLLSLAKLSPVPEFTVPAPKTAFPGLLPDPCPWGSAQVCPEHCPAPTNLVLLYLWGPPT